MGGGSLHDRQKNVIIYAACRFLLVKSYLNLANMFTIKIIGKINPKINTDALFLMIEATHLKKNNLRKQAKLFKIYLSPFLNQGLVE